MAKNEIDQAPDTTRWSWNIIPLFGVVIAITIKFFQKPEEGFSMLGAIPFLLLTTFYRYCEDRRAFGRGYFTTIVILNLTGLVLAIVGILFGANGYLFLQFVYLTGFVLFDLFILYHRRRDQKRT